MKQRSWSPAAEAKLRELYATTPIARLAFLLKRTEKAVRSRAKVLGITRCKRTPWSKAENEILRARYPHEKTADVARDLGRRIVLVYQHAKKLGLRKTAAFLASPASGRTNGRQGIGTRFEKGHVPMNKGLRRPGWYRGRMRETQFKKGRAASEARNYVPIGAEKIDQKRNVLMRKMTDDRLLVPVMRWKPVHVLVWESANGPVPQGRICIFKRGMKSFVAKEITIDKLEVVTFAENMRRNTVHNLPAPLPRLIQLRGALERKIKARLKDEKQDGGSAQSPVRRAGRPGGSRKADGDRARESD